MYVAAGLRYDVPMSSDDFHSGALLSVGYERRSISELVDLLVSNQVDVLIDVRLNAISRKPGLSKTALSAALETAGIEYLHQRELGNPRDNRDGFRRGESAARDRYLRTLSNGGHSAFSDTIGRARSQRVALFCYERSHVECHRSCITDQAILEDPSMTVVEL